MLFHEPIHSTVIRLWGCSPFLQVLQAYWHPLTALECSTQYSYESDWLIYAHSFQSQFMKATPLKVQGLEETLGLSQRAPKSCTPVCTLQLGRFGLVLALLLEAGLESADLQLIFSGCLLPLVQFGSDAAEVILKGGDLALALAGGLVHGPAEHEDLLLGVVQLLASVADGVLPLLPQALHVSLQLLQLGYTATTNMNMQVWGQRQNHTHMEQPKTHDGRSPPTRYANTNVLNVVYMNSNWCNAGMVDPAVLPADP